MAAWKYTLAEPDLSELEESAVRDCVRSGWLSMGAKTKELEESFAQMHGVRHAMAVSNGTAALHLALVALDVGGRAEDEVIQPSMNFVASANMTKAVGARPVFSDILSLAEPTIDPADVARRITGNTRAIIVMHYGGYSVRLKEIMDIASARGVPIIEDACHAPAQPSGEYPGRYLGTIGKVGCFSFFSNKNMTCGEGGMVVTNDDELAARIRSFRSHGMTTLSWDRHHGRASSYDVIAHGFNYRIDDLRASMALVQLGKLEAGNNRRRELAAAYADAVEKYGRGRIQFVNGGKPTAGTAHIATVLVAASRRDDVRRRLQDSGIQTSLHYPPVHKFSAFAGYCTEALPTTEEYSDRVITLPLHVRLPIGATDEIVKLMASV